MKVKAKGMLWAVALSLCCMGCGAQETPASQPVEESVSVAETSREETQDEPSAPYSAPEEESRASSGEGQAPAGQPDYLLRVTYELDPTVYWESTDPAIVQDFDKCVNDYLKWYMEGDFEAENFIVDIHTPQGAAQQRIRVGFDQPDLKVVLRDKKLGIWTLNVESSDKIKAYLQELAGRLPLKPEECNGVTLYQSDPKTGDTLATATLIKVPAEEVISNHLDGMAKCETRTPPEGGKLPIHVDVFYQVGDKREVNGTYLFFDDGYAIQHYGKKKETWCKAAEGTYETLLKLLEPTPPAEE